MYVISVVPLKKGVGIDTLSYFSPITYQEGTIVTIPIRKASVLGMVTGSEEVSTTKTALRAATFSLKKLPPQEKPATLGKAYVETARKLSEHYAAPLGTILYNLLPPEIRSGDIPLPHTHTPQTARGEAPYLFQATKADRYLAYRSLVREVFAHSGSVLIVVPSSIEAQSIERELEAGITDRIVLLTSALTKTELKKAYARLEDFSKAKLIITTQSHALIERHDITLVIVEHARSSYYKELTRPYLDYRDVLVEHSKQSGRKIILADLLPRTEEEVLRRNEFYHTHGETPKRLDLIGLLQLVDMTKQKDQQSFTLFDESTLEAMRKILKKNGRIFVFAARRGIAPLVICSDCSHIFRSKESGAPYSLVRTMKNGVEERWFVCSTSGERVRAEDVCPSCGSWRLRERGIGVQQVHDELHKLFTKSPIILFDHTSANTFKKANFLHETFYKTKGAILVGTYMALPYLSHPVDLSVIANMDALLATPTWRLEEDNLAILLTLREITDGQVIVQSRAPETGILTHARHAATEQFYNEEIELRRTFAYPPFSTFIHLTWQGDASTVKELEVEIKKILGNYPLTVYQDPNSPASQPVLHGLIRLQKSAWPDSTLAGLLRSIHPSVRIMINPDKIV